MGQYKQWQYYREADQRLQSQLSRLSSDLSNLQAQKQQLEQNLSLADNSIIRSLLAQLLPIPTPLAEEPKAESIPILSSEVEAELPSLATSSPIISAEPEPILADSAASVVYAGLVFAAEIAPTAETEPTISETPAPTPYEILDLSPEEKREMLADEQGQTAPIRAIPWWFRNTSVNPTGQEGPFTDQQSSRTNQLVERWMERWGRSEDEPQPREEQR